MRPERQGKNKMNIRPAEKADMPALCALYAEGRRFMAAHGNAAQWRGGYPQRAVLESDMRERRLYLCGENGALCAAFVYFTWGRSPRTRPWTAHGCAQGPTAWCTGFVRPGV